MDLINKVILGDCLEVMKEIPDKSVDMILCDLPYGTTACSWDEIIPLDKMWMQYNRVIKDNQPICLFASQPFTFKLINSNFENFKYCWYWNKDKGGNFATAKYQPLRVIEEIVILGNGSVKYNPQMVSADEKNIRSRDKGYTVQDETTHGIASGTFKVSDNHNEKLRYPKNLINIKSTEKECNNTARLHPTQKPISLMEYLIKTYTSEGDLILDNCAGSFTTSVAADNLNRNWIGIEKELQYCEIGQKRINENREKLKKEKISDIIR